MCWRVTYNNPWLLVTSLIKLLYHEDLSFLGVVLCGMEGHEQLQGKGSTGSRQSFYSPSFVWRGGYWWCFFLKRTRLSHLIGGIDDRLSFSLHQFNICWYLIICWLLWIHTYHMMYHTPLLLHHYSPENTASEKRHCQEYFPFWGPVTFPGQTKNFGGVKHLPSDCSIHGTNGIMMFVLHFTIKEVNQV